jgi:hypothetical protein
MQIQCPGISIRYISIQTPQQALEEHREIPLMRAGEVKTGSFALDAPTEPELARRRGLKRENREAL